MAEIPKNNTGLSGEYFVAAELYRRGWSVGLTIGNAKAIDILAEMENIVVQIQVKSIFKKSNNGWPIMRDRIKKECVYIFVNLNGDKMSGPEYFICTSKEAYVAVDQYPTRGIVPVRKLNSAQYKDRWDKLTVQSRKIKRVAK
jgi:hypothetical protein